MQCNTAIRIGRQFHLDKRILCQFKRFHSTVDTDDVAKHSLLANEWWDKTGPMKALHSLNQIRVPFIRNGLINSNKIKPELIRTSTPLKNIKILEIGCGAGILTEQLARLQANVTAIDPGIDVINAAKDHLEETVSNTNNDIRKLITYKVQSIETHLDLNPDTKYDAVVVSEVLEHVNDKLAFLEACTRPLKSGGSIFITTFNQTYLSWLAGIIVAENILKLVPQNTHDWNKFISPNEVKQILSDYDCSTILINGFTYDVICDKWRWINTKDLSYALQAIKN